MGWIGHRHRQGNQLGAKLDMSHSDSDITTPDVDDRRATAVVTGIHALIILLLKFCMEGKNPVGTFLVGTALVGPESRRTCTALRVHGIPVVSPTLDRELGFS